MKFGSIDIKNCNECPAYRWHGESCSEGNIGYYCCFGAFSRCHAENKQVPPNCPIRMQREEIKELKAMSAQKGART